MKTPKPRKLSSGNWNIRLCINGERISRTFENRKDAIRWADLEKAKHLNNAGVTPSSFRMLTLSDAIDRFMEYKQNTLSPSTIRRYEQYKKGDIADLMPMYTAYIDWEKWVNERAKEYSPKTIKNTVSFVKAVYKYNKLPVPEINNLPKEMPNELPWLKHEQMLTLIDAVHGTPLELQTLLALNGLRRSEIFALNKSSIDLENAEIRVRGAVVEGSEGFVYKNSNKTKTSVRNCPILMPNLLECLQNWDGKMPYSVNSLCHAINRVCAANDLPQVGIHGCRRTFASFLAHAKVPENIAMEWGGWESIEVMRKHYLRTSKEDRSDYADSVRQYFVQPNGNDLPNAFCENTVK